MDDHALEILINTQKSEGAIGFTPGLHRGQFTGFDQPFAAVKKANPSRFQVVCDLDPKRYGGWRYVEACELRLCARDCCASHVSIG